MSKSLPTAPSMEHLKKQAKDLRKSHKNRNPECCETLKLLHQLSTVTNDGVFDAKVSLNEAQLALALSYGFKSWPELKSQVLHKTDNLKFLHIHCGDASAQPLRDSSVPGDVLVWREIYIEGPVPGDLPEDDFCKVRAESLSNLPGMAVTYESILEGCRARYNMLASAGKHEEVVLWFDSCMFDQTIMIHVIDLCAKYNWPDTKLSLICVDQGLGGLSPDELITLLDPRHTITPDEISLAHTAWKAFTSDDPKEIEDVLQGDCAALPFLRDALLRHLEQYPSASNGLNRTQHQILSVVEKGTEKLIDIFRAVLDMEQCPFMGDTYLWARIEELAGQKKPLLKLDGPGRILNHLEIDPEDYVPLTRKQLQQWDVSLTDAGRSVLAGKQDHIQLNGIDRWLGGVHLQGHEAQWRWDQWKLIPLSTPTI